MDDVVEEEMIHGHIDPAKEFCLALVAGPNDSSHQVDWDGNTGFPTQERALEWAKNSVEESGGEYMLYRCIPFKRVVRGQTRVMAFTPRKGR